MNKSYKQFSLITLQLIIPLSTMTKAEYKNAYGIDLDDIDIERVTLLQEDGSKNKYFVDEIKTTENGVDIYAGGKILSIGSSVSVVNNAYSVDNAKPIYYHGILIQSKGNGSLYTMCLKILNTSNELINSWDKLLAVFNNWGSDALVEVNGFYNYDNEAMVNTAFFFLGTSTLSLFGNTSSSTRTNVAKSFSAWGSIFGEEGAVIEDRVNKIN